MTQFCKRHQKQAHATLALTQRDYETKLDCTCHLQIHLYIYISTPFQPLENENMLLISLFKTSVDSCQSIWWCCKAQLGLYIVLQRTIGQAAKPNSPANDPYTDFFGWVNVFKLFRAKKIYTCLLHLHNFVIASFCHCFRQLIIYIYTVAFCFKLQKFQFRPLSSHSSARWARTVRQQGNTVGRRSGIF